MSYDITSPRNNLHLELSISSRDPTTLGDSFLKVNITHNYGATSPSTSKRSNLLNRRDNKIIKPISTHINKVAKQEPLILDEPLSASEITDPRLKTPRYNDTKIISDESPSFFTPVHEYERLRYIPHTKIYTIAASSRAIVILELSDSKTSCIIKPVSQLRKCADDDLYNPDITAILNANKILDTKLLAVINNKHQLLVHKSQIAILSKITDIKIQVSVAKKIHLIPLIAESKDDFIVEYRYYHELESCFRQYLQESQFSDEDFDKRVSVDFDSLYSSKNKKSDSNKAKSGCITCNIL